MSGTFWQQTIGRHCLRRAFNELGYGARYVFSPTDTSKGFLRRYLEQVADNIAVVRGEAGWNGRSQNSEFLAAERSARFFETAPAPRFTPQKKSRNSSLVGFRELRQRLQRGAIKKPVMIVSTIMSR